jgi:hypothetical protein
MIRPDGPAPTTQTLAVGEPVTVPPIDYLCGDLLLMRWAQECPRHVTPGMSPNVVVGSGGLTVVAEA